MEKRPRGRPRKNKPELLTEQNLPAEPVPPTNIEGNLKDKAFEGIKHSGDPFDKNLYGAAYDKTYSKQSWDDSNPMEVPVDIRNSMPGTAFKFRAIDHKTGHLRKGDHYDGWQVYKSDGYPQGLKYGGDTILAFMPQEQADARNRHYQQESSDRVRDAQENQLAALDRAAAELAAKGVEFQPFEPGYRHSARGKTALPTGINIGPSRRHNKATGEVREQHRGYHPEQIREMAARQKEGRSKNRKYSFAGQTKRG